MNNKIAAFLLALFLAVPSFAENVGAFNKFSMGVMFGFGPSFLTGAGDIYDETLSPGVDLYFAMAFPVTNRMSVQVDVGADGAFGFGGDYELNHRSIKDSIETSAFEIVALWNVFLTDEIFISAGPSVRFSKIDEYVEVNDEEVYSGSPDYANDFWLDAVVALGAKFGEAECGLRVGYEFLGFYKETDDYKDVGINELRFRFYFTYWFGQKK